GRPPECRPARHARRAPGRSPGRRAAPSPASAEPRPRPAVLAGRAHRRPGWLCGLGARVVRRALALGGEDGPGRRGRGDRRDLGRRRAPGGSSSGDPAGAADGAARSVGRPAARGRTPALGAARPSASGPRRGEPRPGAVRAARWCGPMIAAAQARQALEQLGLAEAATVLESRLEAAAQKQLPYADFLADLLASETTVRRERYLRARTRLA